MAQSRRMVDGIEIVDYRELKIQRVLGRGAFGIVYIAQYRDRRTPGPVVMKQIHEPVDDIARKLFMKEAKLLNGLQHENIVQMHGICVAPLVIVMEYVCFDFKPFLDKTIQTNTVDNFLLEVSKLPKSQKTFDHLIPAIASDIAKGLSYLHNLDIAHRDLKPMNVLISNQHYCDLEDSHKIKRIMLEKPVVCKLADFGESRSQLLQTDRCNDPGTNLVGRGTIPFMAPEILLPEEMAPLGTKLSLEDLKRVDIWALGQVFYCLINPGVSCPFEREGLDVPRIMLMHRQRKRPSVDPGYQPKHTTVWSRVHAAFEACSKHKPSERPTATEVMVILHAHPPAIRHGLHYLTYLIENPEVAVQHDTITVVNETFFTEYHFILAEVDMRIGIPLRAPPLEGVSTPKQKPPERSHLLGNPAHTPGVQWYVGEQGESDLKHVFDELSQIADSDVNMSRNTVTQDVSMSFTHHGQEWEVTFPLKFPRSKAILSSGGEERRTIGGDTVESAVRGIISVLVSSLNQPLPRGQGHPSPKACDQWYSGTQGEADLKFVFDELTTIADGELKMTRKTDTQDITLRFVRQGQAWQVKFPAKFPKSKACLVKDKQRYGNIGGENVNIAVNAIISRILSAKDTAANMFAESPQNAANQWYAGDEGEAALKYVYNELKKIADGEMKMSRNIDSQVVKLSLDYQGQMWQVTFPPNFPRSYATLHKNENQCGKAGGESVESATSAIINHIAGPRYTDNEDEVDMFEPTTVAQWYAGDQGESSLKYVCQQLTQISNADVRMSRNKNTQDITLSFERHGHQWQVKLPSNFPSSNARLIFNGDVYAEVGGNTIETAVSAIKNRILSVDQPAAKTVYWKAASCATQ